MSALVVQPAVGRAAPATAAAHPRPAPASPQRGHLQLVGPGFVPVGDREPARPTVAPVRLTARGRRAVAIAAFVAATALAVVVGSLVGAALAPRTAGEASLVTVAPGDSLWALAADAASPGQDVRDVVAEIVALNTLAGPTVRAGQELLVPQG